MMSKTHCATFTLALRTLTRMQTLASTQPHTYANTQARKRIHTLTRANAYAQKLSSDWRTMQHVLC